MFGALQDREGSCLHGRLAHLNLEQGSARQCFLEQVQRIVIIKDLDRVCQCNELFRADLLVRLVLFRLQRAALGGVRKELLVTRERILTVRKFTLLSYDVNSQLCAALGFRLDALCQSSDLLLLGTKQGLEATDGLFFRCLHISQVLRCGIFHLLQDSDDLTALWLIILTIASRKEGREHITVHVTDVHGDGDLLQNSGG
mmetsp:Transcript_30348/g.53320  ORF Transcript_30348/g.53320 Transcript_30348/m.53320 type:complete len:200 (+) Transcript_30348:1056-1655(+)